MFINIITLLQAGFEIKYSKFGHHFINSDDKATFAPDMSDVVKVSLRCPFILSEISLMLLTCSWTYKIVTICTGFDASSCMRFIGAGPFKALCREYGSMMNYRQEMDWLPDAAGKPGSLMVDVCKVNTHQASYWWKLDILNLKAAVLTHLSGTPVWK